MPGRLSRRLWIGSPRLGPSLLNTCSKWSSMTFCERKNSNQDSNFCVLNVVCGTSLIPGGVWRWNDDYGASSEITTNQTFVNEYAVR
jgi:hypothetical protein